MNDNREKITSLAERILLLIYEAELKKDLAVRSRIEDMAEKAIRHAAIFYQIEEKKLAESNLK